MLQYGTRLLEMSNVGILATDHEQSLKYWQLLQDEVALNIKEYDCFGLLGLP